MVPVRRAILVAVALSLALPAAAGAGTLEVVDGEIVFEAAPGEANRLTVTGDVSTSEDTWNDEGASFSAIPAECRFMGTSGNWVVCPFSLSMDRKLFLGDRDDQATVVEQPGTGFAEIFGGHGDDTITGAATATNLLGDGPNTASGALYAYAPAGDGDDVVSGAWGDDFVDGGAGADDVRGEGGTDGLLYGGWTEGATADDRTVRVVVDADGAAGDDGEDANGNGVAEEGDTVQPDFEILGGGEGPDRLSNGTSRVATPASPGGVYGRGGNDMLIARSTLPDVFSGGGGTDTVSYASRSAAQPLSVTVDGVANDGLTTIGSEEGDDVGLDVENVTGGSGRDSLVGSAAANVLNGGPGADVLRGLAGIDTVTYAGRGASESLVVRLGGTAGNDGGALDDSGGRRDDVRRDVENVIGGAGDDTLYGSEIANVLTGGPGADALFGRDGSDRIAAADGAADAVVDCDTGAASPGIADVARVDPVDPATAPGCETVIRR